MRRARAFAASCAVFAAVVTAAPWAADAGNEPAGDAATVSGTVSRVHLEPDGTEKTAATDHVTMSIDHTHNLRGRQQVTVTWSGAHPTGGVWPDENAGDAAKQEYPFVLLECRGTDSANAPLTPQTCWTQTWAERYQADFGNLFPAWRLDRYASAADRAQFAEAPDPLPSTCHAFAVADRWVPFIGADGTVFQGGSQGCAGQAPESANVGGNSALPSNTTYGITDATGGGRVKFDVWTDDENASLGCSYKVACSIVAVPVEGMSCDVAGLSLPSDERVPSDQAADAEAGCEASGQYAAGEPASAGIRPDEAVTGSLWWAASNWHNRLSVPITFAQPSSVCDVVSGGTRVDVYGSELMAEASGQWAPYFCTNSALFNLTHVQTAEPEARSLVSAGSIEAAYSSDAPDGGWGRPVVQAPVAVTGFAVTYIVDDASGQEVDSLRLTPRLLAKLLTESYVGDVLVQSNYPALTHNPINITTDPEFRALNPKIPASPGNPTASVLLSLSTNSDVMSALTSYINADPEARAWLNGTPDPWGMVVNPHYKRVALPVARWTLADTFLLPKAYIDQQLNPCYSASPTPYLGLIASPMATLAGIAERVEFALSNVDTACPNGIPGDLATLNLSTLGRQQPGHRFMLALTSLGEDSRYNLVAAALQSSAQPPTGQFTNASGRTFVPPTDAALRAAATTFMPSDATGTWQISYPALRRTPSAYPGTMVVYADVPTSGLSTDAAARYATLVKLAATTLQLPGAGNGQLPGGYLPMTAANGLGGMVAYAQAAAAAIQAQRGVIPSPTAAGAPSRGGGASNRPTGGVGGAPAGRQLPTAPSGSGSAAASRAAGTYPNVASGDSAQPQIRTVAASSGLAGWAVPMLAALMFGTALLAAGLRIVPRLERGRPRTRTGRRRRPLLRRRR